MNLKVFIGILLLSTISFGLFAQSIPNNSFENWGLQQSYEEPDQFSSSNPISVSTGGVANVIKTGDSHSGNFAVELETIAINGENLLSGIYIGEIAADQQSVVGGVPFSERPDSVKGYVKYNVPEFDTASFIVVFKKFGQPYGFGLAQFTGVQNTWAEFSAPIVWLFPIISPDTLVTGMSSSTIFAEPMEGSTIILDDIHFVGTSLPYPNAGFEDWNEVLSEEEVPDDWFTSNAFNTESSGIGITKTEDSYEGDFAAKLENKVVLWGDTIAVLTNGAFGENGVFGGMSVDKTPERLTGHYKYSPVGQDSAIVSVTLFHFNDTTNVTEILETTQIKLGTASEYSLFELTIPYNAYPTPNIVNISFFAGKTDGGAGFGSTLFVDALQMTYKPDGIGDMVTTNGFVAFPNPVSKTLFFQFKQPIYKDINVAIIDLMGKTVFQKTIKAAQSESFNLEVSNLENGFYFYRMTSQESGEAITGKFLKK
jgi:hypothetical protein